MTSGVAPGAFGVFWYLKFKGFKGFQDLEAPVV